MSLQGYGQHKGPGTLTDSETIRDSETTIQTKGPGAVFQYQIGPFSGQSGENEHLGGIEKDGDV